VTSSSDGAAGAGGSLPPPSLAAALRAASLAAGAGIYLGAGAGGWAWAEPERSALVLGPSRSGKTSALVVPNVLAAPGPVVSTSTKPDVLAATAGARGAAGRALLYDPSGTVRPPPGVTRVGWSPVNAALDWDDALLTADAMVRAARPAVRLGAGAEEHWTERAGSLLAPLLHGAALVGHPMGSVVRWVDRHDGSEALSVLAGRPGDGGPAADVLAGILTTDEREQSGIWSTASGVLGAYRSSAALASTEPPFLEAGSFCSASNTLYVCAAGRRQRLLAPLVVGLLTELRDAAYRQAGQGPPLLAALDEVANIAPIPDLPAMVSEGGGQGLVTLACLQDLSQARARWGEEASSFLSLFGTTLVLGGIADMATLEALSALGGDIEVASRTVGAAAGRDGKVRPSTTVSGILRRRLPVDVIARGRPGQALALDAHNRIGWVGLTPAHRDRPWRDLLGRGADRAHDLGQPLPGRSR